jgi:branched-chain amino acid transport system permease protein
MTVVYHILIVTGIYVILASSLNLSLGYAGQFSVAHGAFYGIGAYAGTLLAMSLGIPFWAELLAAGAIAGLFGLVIAYPTLRMKGDYLALATFAFAIIVYSVLDNWFELTRGPLGISRIPPAILFGVTFSRPWAYTLLVYFFVGLELLILWRLTNSSFGRVLTAIREDETATLSIGKNVSAFKIISFVIGSFFAGLAGVLFSHYFRFIDPSSFALAESFLILSMVVFGGMGTLQGSIVGAVIMVVIPEALRYLGLPSYIAGHLRQVIFGALLTIIILRRPQGLLGKKEI